jgi:hypothetical protein
MSRKRKREIEREIDHLEAEQNAENPAFAVELEDGTLIEPGGGPYEGGAPFKLPYELWYDEWGETEWNQQKEYETE